MSTDININDYIKNSFQEIEGVSSSLAEIFFTADAGLSFAGDHSSDNFDSTISAIETFSIHVIDLCDNYIQSNRLSTYSEYFLRCRNFHSELLENLKVFKDTYKQQMSLYQ